MTQRVSLAAILVYLSAAACGTDEALLPPDDAELPSPLVTGPAEGLQLSASVSRTVIAIGDTATLTFVLRNPTLRTVTLQFSSSCQILPYIRDSKAMVHPRGGGWGCGAALTQLTLVPGQSRTVPVIVHGGVPYEPMYGVVALNPGQHHAYAELGDGMGRSHTVTFRVVVD